MLVFSASMKQSNDNTTAALNFIHKEPVKVIKSKFGKLTCGDSDIVEHEHVPTICSNGRSA